MAALTLYSTLVLPFRLAFQTVVGKPCMEDASAPFSSRDCGFFVSDTLIDAFFFVDIGFSFCTAVQAASGELILEPRRIARHYLGGFFAIDLLSCLPYGAADFVDTGGDESVKALKLLRTLRLMRLLKLARLLKNSARIRKIQQDFGLNKALTQLVELILGIMLVLHFSGCVWFATTLSTQSLPSGTYQLSWASLLTHYGLDCKAGGACEPNASEGIRYLASVYWAFTTLSTIGFGDIKANSDAEKVVACIVMLIGAVMLGYILSRFTDLVSSVNIKAARRRSRLGMLKVSLRDAALPKPLRQRMTEYYNEYLREGTEYAEHSLLQQLSPPLKTELLIFLMKEMIQNVAFFHEREPAFIVSVCKLLQPLYAAPGDVLCQEGALGSEMYFLQSGTVETRRVRNGVDKQMGRLNAQAYFGEVAVLLAGERREMTVRALTFCCLFSFSREQLQLLLTLFPEARVALTEYGLKKLSKSNPLARLRRCFRLIRIGVRWKAQARSHTAEEEAIAEAENRMSLGEDLVPDSRRAARPGFGALDPLTQPLGRGSLGARAPAAVDEIHGRLRTSTRAAEDLHESSCKRPSLSGLAC
jgi:CRP-like cAMP-binding protein